MPLRHTVLGLQARTGERPTRVFPRENMVRAAGLVRLVLGDIEDGAFYGYVGWFVGIRA